ncbi:hypothetical protein C3B79_0278 [Aeromonas hydrophila]|nr:hypothetical protein C3B79_0278 [Aeromonas hydrophila]
MLHCLLLGSFDLSDVCWSVEEVQTTPPVTVTHRVSCSACTPTVSIHAGGAGGPSGQGDARPARIRVTRSAAGTPVPSG